MNVAKVFIGSDHAGVEVKEKIIEILETFNFEIEDLGAFKDDGCVDYPIYAKAVCENVLKLPNSFGVLICGSGVGMEIAANRFKGIRAGFAYDVYSAKMSRFDNNSNVLTLRARNFDGDYKKIVETFFTTNFSEEERHIRRIKLLDELN